MRCYKLYQRFFLLPAALLLLSTVHCGGGGSSSSGGGGTPPSTGPYSTLFNGIDEEAVTDALLDDILDNPRIEIFSFSFWMKIVTLPASNQGIMGSTTDNAWNDGIGVYWNAAQSNLVFFVNHWNNNKAAYNGINTNTWYHVAATFDESLGSNNLRLFINGTPVASANYPAQAQRIPSRGLQFGGMGLSHSNVKIDHAMIWNNVLGDGEITEIYNGGASFDPTTDAGGYASSSDLRGFWTMGDGDSFPVISDYSGMGFDAEMQNCEASDFVSDTP